MDVGHAVKRDLQLADAVFAKQIGERVEFDAVRDRPYRCASLACPIDDELAAGRVNAVRGSPPNSPILFTDS